MIKRLFDVMLAGFGLLLLGPVFVLIAVWIKLDSPGPVMFRQERVGRFGRPFWIHKFRTMRVDAPERGLQITVGADPRITRSGRLLRATKLDELPQLWDVVRGEMSLVGPRPEVPRYVAHYPPEWRERLLSMRPGITDFASVRYRDESQLLAQALNPEREYIDVVLPAKLQYALRYVDNPSFTSDLRVIGLTLRTVFVPRLPSPWSLLPMKNSSFWSWLDRHMSTLSPRNRRLATAVDALVVLACWHITYLFRLGFERWQPGRPWYDDYVSFGVVAVYLLAMVWAGVPRGLWRFFGFDDFRRIALACALAGLVSAVGVLMAQLVGVARAVLVLHPMFCVVALCLTRMAYRMLWEHARACAQGEDYEQRRAIVMGAGDAARRVVSTLHRREGWTILALLDDDRAKWHLRIGGVGVEGGLADVTLPHLMSGATHVIVALPSATPEQQERALALARETGLVVMTVPERGSLNADAPS